MVHDLRTIVYDSAAIWNRNPPCKEEELRALIEVAPVSLPDDYLEFLRLANGGEGTLPVSPGWFIIWPAGEVMLSNGDNEREEYYRDLFLFGSCDGNLFGFNLTHGLPWSIVALDYLDNKRECLDQLGTDFTEFAKLLGRSREAV